jgi:hypothetical protein
MDATGIDSFGDIGSSWPGNGRLSLVFTAVACIVLCRVGAVVLGITDKERLSVEPFFPERAQWTERL